MGLKLYCNRYTHFKDPLVCAVVCPYRTRCRDFALFYDERREVVDGLVADYYAARRDDTPRRPRAFGTVAEAVEMRALIRLEVKHQMPESSYIWIGKDDQAELLTQEDIIRRAERGMKAKTIYRVAQEMELRFQLVPRKRIEKAKRVVADEAERAAARRSRRSRTTSTDAPPAPLAAIPPTEETPVIPLRRRVAKAASRKQ